MCDIAAGGRGVCGRGHRLCLELSQRTMVGALCHQIPADATFMLQTLFQQLLPSKANGNDDSQAVADALWRQELGLSASVDVFDGAGTMWRRGSVIGVNDQWLRVSFEGTTGVAVWVSRDSPRIAPKDSKVTPTVNVKDEGERWREALRAECEVDVLSSVDNKWFCGRVAMRRAGVYEVSQMLRAWAGLRGR